jgi:hypothetical protein
VIRPVNAFLTPQLLVSLVVGLTVACVILGIALFLGRRRDRSRQSPFHAGLITRSSDWELPQKSYGNRRGSTRREGSPVKVTLSSPVFKNGVASGYVIDRSTGGLRIALQLGYATGGTLLVRAVNAPDTIPWVTVIVRSCQPNGKHYELGCEFDKTPPWNVLLLFG